jgi:hypothetical protein
VEVSRDRALDRNDVEEYLQGVASSGNKEASNVCVMKKKISLLDECVREKTGFFQLRGTSDFHMMRRTYNR